MDDVVLRVQLRFSDPASTEKYCPARLKIHKSCLKNQPVLTDAFKRHLEAAKCFFFFFDVNASATSNQPVEHPVLNAFHPTRMRLCVEYHAFREVRALCGQQVQQAS